MTKKITTKELSRLNELIHQYFGGEINIHVMHGFLVSYLCSGLSEPFIGVLFGGDENGVIFEMIDAPDPITNKEFAELLIGKLYNSAIELSNRGNLILPLISANLYNVEFNIQSLTTSSKKNLLDWYMGFYSGYTNIWDHKLIGNYIEPRSGLPEEQDISSQRFIMALHVHYVAAYNLIMELKPKYKNKDFADNIKKLKGTVERLSSEQIANYDMLSKERSSYLNCTTILIEVVNEAKDYVRNKKQNNLETRH